MACGCQGNQIQTPVERQAARAARAEQRLAARAARVRSDTTASTRYWNGPKGKSAA